MDTVRKPALIAALVLILIVVLAELGAVELLRGKVPQVGSLEELAAQNGLPENALDAVDPPEIGRPPGLAIRYLALVDGILLFTVGLIVLSLVIGQRIQARIQGGITLVFAVLLLGLSIGLIVVAIGKLMLMATLLLAIPFGTLVYLILYGFFNVSGAAAILGLLLALKIAFGVCLVAAQQRFLENIPLVLLFLTSLLAGVVVTFLHGVVPGFLASITDAVAAIVVGILGAIWLIVLLIVSVPAMVKALQPGPA